jgi:hypothetical protein
VKGFTREVENNQPDENNLNSAKRDFEYDLLLELFDFKSLQRGLSYLLKQMKDNAASLHLKLIEDFEAISTNFSNDVVLISEKFHPQIQQLFHEVPELEQNSRLQERIMKACEYFDEKISLILPSAWRRHTIETDNKAVKKSLLESVDHLKEETNLKQACLNEGKSGINVQKYLRVRAVFAIEKPVEIRKKTDEKVASHIPNPELYKALRQWRKSKAEDADVPEYQVLNQQSLVQLVTLLPISKRGLLSIKGIGKTKMGTFGDELTEIVSDYCSKKGLETRLPEPLERKRQQVEEKPNTRQIRYELFSKGKTIDQIVKARRLTAGTIEGHLLAYIRSGEIGINELVSDEKINLVIKYFGENNSASPGMAKQELGEQISWGELRMILAHLNK